MIEVPFYLSEDQREIYAMGIADTAAPFLEQADTLYEDGAQRALDQGRLCHEIVAAGGARAVAVYHRAPPKELFHGVTIPVAVCCLTTTRAEQELLDTVLDQARRAQSHIAACKDPCTAEMAQTVLDQVQAVYDARDVSMMRALQPFVEDVQRSVDACTR